MIEHSREFRRIKKLWPWRIVTSIDSYFLIEVKEKEDLGVWFAHRCRKGLLFHASMGDKCRGKEAAKSGRDAIAWLFKNTETPVIYASIPPERRAARMLTRYVGFEFMMCYNDNRIYSIERAV